MKKDKGVTLKDMKMIPQVSFKINEEKPIRIAAKEQSPSNGNFLLVVYWLNLTLSTISPIQGIYQEI